jgi:hypothetical protein
MGAGKSQFEEQQTGGALRMEGAPSYLSVEVKKVDHLRTREHQECGSVLGKFMSQ